LVRFQYVRPATVEGALATLQEAGARATLLAGGTDVLVRLRSGRIRPAVVVDLKRIDGLETGIRRLDATLRVGARCTMAALIADERVRQEFPALVEAARVVGSVQIRNRATLAGNICNASPAADTAPPLLAYGAIVNTRGIAGERRVPLQQFFTGPGKTLCGRDEIVTSIDLPLPAGPVGAAFLRLTRRRGVDLATLTVCCAISSSGDVRVALGAVAPTPLLIEGERAHDGDLLRAPEHLERLVARIAAHASPISDVRAGADYRSAMLPVFIRRAIELALKRLDENERWNPTGSQSPSR
jgi:carbon-monoxide dehydrogenase medium subunit